MRLSSHALADCSSVALQPGDEAMVPTVWDRAVPEEDFIAESCGGVEGMPLMESLPGVMPGSTNRVLVCVQNKSLEVATITRGVPLIKAIDTVAALSGIGPAEGSESLAMKSLKRGEFDVSTVLSVLRTADIPASSTRANVIPTGQDRVQSMLLGLYRHGPEYGVTSATASKPWLTRFLLGFLRSKLPHFPCTSIQVNFGFACRPHVDRSNRGPSATIGLGSYTGGGLWVEDQQGRTSRSISPGEGAVGRSYPTNTSVPGRILDSKSK